MPELVPDGTNATNATDDTANPVIGGWCLVVRTSGRPEQVAATVESVVQGTTTPEKVRVQRGERAGDLLDTHEYEFLRWIKQEDVDP